MRAFTAALLALFATSPAFAGAWLQADDEGLAIHQLTYFSGSDYYNRGGHTASQPSFNKLEYQPYVEYGMADDVTVGGSVSLQRDWQSGKSNDGIADLELFVRQEIYKDDAQVISVQPLVKLPSAFTRDHSLPRGGSHSTDAEVSLLYGRNVDLFTPKDYVDLRAGYRARSHGLSGQYKADASLGFSPATDWQITPALRYVTATALDNRTIFTQNGETDYDLLKAEVTVAYQLADREWVQAGVFDHLAGKQTGAGQGVTLGYATGF